MNAHNEQQWPEYLMLRDTGLADDAGGLGQRIFTTAGAGYVKQKYVRADIAAQPAAAQEVVAWQVDDEFYPSESLAIEAIQQWGPSGAIAIPLYAAAPVTAAQEAVGWFTDGEVLVTVSGLTGSGKSAVAGEIEILCKALGLEVEWTNGDEEKYLTHADWTEALELYKPRVRIVEINIPRVQAGDAEVQP